MSIVCPAILAANQDDYKNQIDKVAGFAKRIQIDVKDNIFALGESLALADIWWPEGVEADIHMMYESPQDYLETIIKLKPSLVIVHPESTCDIPKFAADLRDAGIKTGLAILQDTTIAQISYIFPHIQHLMIFSGNLGHFGGVTDLGLTSKITEAKSLHKYLEIGWDGGINADNAAQLAAAGVDVLNVGGAIQNAENPQEAYATISSMLG